jgi:asparagine synthase (glutamine-hydrolysing)|uniref:Glutamine amidotransferase type-2 domain-containing protein n=1 Tax=viral metagenome TaxID=1070528 RepID=A0A6C0IUR9_9ZZZZ
MLLEQYKEKGTEFIKDLDGEFTFIIFDFKKNIILQSSDIFGIKPQWYNITEDGIIVSSFRSSVCQCSALEEEFTNRKINSK